MQYKTPLQVLCLAFNICKLKGKQNEHILYHLELMTFYELVRI